MPELTPIHIGLLVLTLVSGLVLGWILRSRRSTREKIAVNAGWQEQLESQQSEHQRLAEQNKGLMEQISQYQGNSRDTAERLNALKTSLSESYTLRDQLQQELKEQRGNLRMTKVQRDRFKAAYDDVETRLNSTMSVLEQKDEKIARLKKELASWAERLPPLVEKFKLKNEEIASLETELEALRGRDDEIEALRTALEEAEARAAEVEPLQSKLRDAGALREENAALRGELEEARTAAGELESLRRQLRDTETLREEVEALRGARDNAEARSATIDTLRAELGQAVARLAQLESMDFGGQTRVEPVSPERLPEGMVASNEPHDDAEPALAGDDLPQGDGEDPDTGLQMILAAPSTGAAKSAGNGAEPVAGQAFDGAENPARDPDDLKRIKGIGPAIEKTLNDLGIYRFAQIAGLTEYEIDRVAQRMKGFRTRIYREDWLGQARDLHYQKTRHLP